MIAKTVASTGRFMLTDDRLITNWLIKI
jgi:hypothetical protein